VTLGIITEITVKLIPPQAKRTFLAYFDNSHTAGEAVKVIGVRFRWAAPRGQGCAADSVPAET
jgi:FAD/FMN-containing dehydrogenase